MKGALEIKNLAYEAGDRSILSGLSLTVKPGTVHALIGTNGTGKSTLASIIMGLGGYSPSKGEMTFDDKSIRGIPTHERARLGITLAWQEPVRFEGITVEDYLKLGRRRLNGNGGGGSTAAVCLDLVGLDPAKYLSRHVDRSLSGGERKRIELASVLAMQPALAILDEPDSGIDILSIDGVIKVIRAFRDRGAGVLVITHREEIARSADVASQLCEGRIVNTGDPEEVADRFREMACVTCTKTSNRECADA